MKPNRLKPFSLRTALVWCLLSLWLAGSVQASVHGLVMIKQPVQPASAGIHSYTEVSNALNTYSPSGHLRYPVGQNTFGQLDIFHPSGAHIDTQCVELCLLMSLAPSALSLGHAGPGAALLGELQGVPAGQTQPAVPPPRSLL